MRDGRFPGRAADGRIRIPRVPLAWCAGLTLAQTGGMILLWRAAEDVGARGAELSAAGLFAPPMGDALHGIASPAGLALAALAFTVSVGLCGCLAAQLSADLLGRRGRRIGWVLALALIPVAGFSGWFSGRPMLALWLACLYLLPLALLLLRAPTGPPEYRRVAGIWAGVLVFSLAVISIAESADLRRLRDAVLSLDGGEALVNAYYRHAMLAAEPIKAPAQRHYLTWSASGARPPSWFRCARTPWLLLPIETMRHADLEVQSATAAGVVLGIPGHGGGSHEVSPGDMGERIEAAIRDADPDGFRRVVAVGFLVGVPGSLAWGLACLVGRMRGQWRGVMICGVIGVTVVTLVPTQERGAVEARLDGTGPERMRAVAAGEAGPEKLREIATADDLLPVRARALAAWVRQTPDPDEAARQVAARPTWYEQWYGYHALIGRGWHPDADRCG